MTPNPFQDEFTTVLHQHVTGKSLHERLAQIRQWQTDLDREGRVPIPGGWVSLTDHAGKPAAPAATPGPSRSVLGRIVGLILVVVVGCGVIQAVRGTSAAADVPSTPVTAADGATAPIALIVGETTIPIRRFDPTQGWPNPAATPDAALWGETTINVVLGLDSGTVKSVFQPLDPGATLTVRRADGSLVGYRLVERVITDASAVEYAAQDHSGLTVVVFDDAQRVIFVAVPAESPVTTAHVANSQVRVTEPQWVVREGQPMVAVTLQMDPPATTPLTVTVGATTTVIAADAVTGTVTIPPPATATVAARVQDGTTTADLSIVLPTRPTLHVTWTGAYEQADGALVATATLTPDGPVVLDTTRGGCQAGTTGTVQPLRLMDTVLPLIVTEPRTVVMICPPLKGGDQTPVTMWIEESRMTMDRP